MTEHTAQVPNALRSAPFRVGLNAENLPEPEAVAASGSSSSLDALETNVESLGDQSTAQLRIHREHWTQRRAIFTALRVSPHEHHQTRARRLSLCCCLPTLGVSGSGKLGLSLARCRDRLCPLCAGKRGSEAANRVTEATKRLDAPRFLTLTCPDREAPLREQLRQLRAALRSLRQSKPWKSHVRGGVYAVEVTLNPNTQRWHPHVHILTDGKFFPHAIIRSAWRAALARSAPLWKLAAEEALIVDIRKVHSASGIGREIAGYLAKPSGVHKWPRPRICEYADAVAGSRMLATFGTLHNVDLDPADANDDPGASTFLAPLSHLDRACRMASPRALRAALELRNVLPFAASLLKHIPPAPDLEQTPGQAEASPALITYLSQLGRLFPDLPPETEVPRPGVEPENADAEKPRRQEKLHFAPRHW